MSSWTQKNVDDLPHIIAGPIVRKVTASEVSVWVAVKSPTPVTLKVYTPFGTSPVISSSAVTPTKVGDNLYVTCVRAYGSNALNSNVAFGYDLEFGASHLNSSGILGTGNQIGKITFTASTERYKAGSVRLPSFLVPPPDVNSLNLFHGSCRKPHGEGVDGLTILHDTISKSQVSGSGITRPHMLCLTGDQIYADDVAGLLLTQIIRYHENDGNGDSLIGWKEKMPHVSASSPDLKPGNRFEIITGQLDIEASDDDTHSHLLRMTEYILMYCMVWSPELWTESLPSFGQTYPGKSSHKNVFRPYSKHSTRATISEETTPLYDRYVKNNEMVGRFKKGLGSVRRALANVAVYMIFDDHDVTDDWFFNERWVKRIIENADSDTKELGRRLMQNGMSAIALCQAWGNKPSQFYGATDPGTKIATAVQALANLGSGANTAAGDTHWEMIEDMVLPFINYMGDAHRLSHHADTFKWHWYYERGDYEIIGLDTRTMRVFRNGYDNPAGLMSDQAIDYQVRDVGTIDKELTILLSGTPLMGVPSIEDFIYNTLDWFVKNETLDLESWNLDPHARQKLISSLLKRKSVGVSGKKHRVLTLSGDVHYAFTNGMYYKAENSFIEHELNAELRMAQFCSSSLKNLTTKGLATTIEQHNRKIDEDWHGFDEDDNNVIIYGWNNYGEDYTPVYPTGISYHNFYLTGKSPALIPKETIRNFWPGYEPTPEPFPGAYVPNPQQDWFYSLGFVTNKPFIVSAITPSGSGVDLKMARAKAHKELSLDKNKSGGAWLVGYPNIGNVEFNWGVSYKEVKHNIVWINNDGQKAFDTDNPVIYVVTEHTVELS